MGGEGCGPASCCDSARKSVWGVGVGVGAVVPARCESRHHDGTVAGPLCPPACPACFHRGDEHDPRRYGVAARTGPGVLWWVRRPMCGTPVCPWQALLSRAAVSLSSHVSETRARSGGMSGSTARLYGITVHHTHTHTPEMRLEAHNRAHRDAPSPLKELEHASPTVAKQVVGPLSANVYGDSHNL